ncbi:MAG: superkiller protein 3 [Chloroflexi bacterium]|jgi:tetratricopeptide (TPR) repeat protein|nr:MAG: superkiller protein 3 [Chloroflexota bacterium]|tara:strand:+ start:197 stop:766 length:570 start_codon:yes stop_codon:yes gene_type:complete
MSHEHQKKLPNMDSIIENMEKEVSDLTEIIDSDPNDSSAYSRRGLLLGQLVRPKDAIDDFTKAITINPEDSNIFYNRGMAYIHVKQLSLAIDDFTQSATLDPANVDAISNAAMAHYESRHYDAAIRESNRAISIDNKRSLPYAVRALSRAALDEEELSLEDLATAVKYGFDAHTLGMLIKQARRKRGEN